VLTVKNELEAAQASVAVVQNGGNTTQAVRSMAAHGAAAASAANDPVWRLFERAPLAGDNLRAVRLASESLDVLSNQLAVPVLTAFGSDSKGGPLTGLIEPMQASSGRIHELASQLAEVAGSNSLIPQVSSGVGQVNRVMTLIDPWIQILPGMAGADGAQNYLVVGQSNTEVLALGGSAASTTLIRVEDGNIKIAKQVDSGDFNNGVPLDVELPDGVERLFGGTMKSNINATVSRPDFPTAAMLTTAFWQRDIRNDRIDGVVSIDPIALSYILEATGPVTLPTGEKVTNENVVSLTMKDVYARYTTDSADADAFLKVVAMGVFEKISAGQFEPPAMLTAVMRAIDRGSLMFWSADPDVQQRVATMQLSGILPTTNQPETMFGVYFRDYSLGSKIDYYMKSAAKVTGSCTAAGKVEYKVAVTLKLDLSARAEAALPDYVRTHRPGAGNAYRTEVFIYGPPGADVRTVDLGDRGKLWRKPGLQDLGRPVASFVATTKPGESATVTATFSIADPGSLGPVAVRTTPMVQATDVSISGSAPCAAR
jgi:hypothetical protein